MDLEQARLALRQAKLNKPTFNQGSSLLYHLAKEYYVEIRELREPPVVTPWRIITDIIVKHTGFRMSSAGLSRAFAKVEIEECKKHGWEPLPGPRAHLKKRDRRKKHGQG